MAVARTPRLWTCLAAAGILLLAAQTWPATQTGAQETERPEAGGQGTGPAGRERVVPQGRDEITLSFAPLVEKVAPAVVNIFTRKLVREGAASPLLEEPITARLFGRALPLIGERERFENALGSGVIVRSDGVIVTNHHVIQGAQDIVVVLGDRRQYPAATLVADARTDLAVLRIDTGGQPLPHLEFGDSTALRVGDLVVAIGNPFGVGQTVTTGIVSALARTSVGVTDFRFFIQTDASINPGNSGGALVDVAGKLVGINTAIFSRGGGGSVGIGFAVPSVMVRAVVEAAVEGRPLIRPRLGVSGQTVTAAAAPLFALPRPIGVRIEALHPGGPLAAAGLAPGDVIAALDGREVEDLQALRFRIATKKVGDTVTLVVIRRGRVGALVVELVAPPAEPPPEETLLRGYHPLSGARVASLSPALAEELGIDSAIPGIVVLDLRRGSRSYDSGLRRGDIIRSIDERPVTLVGDLDAFTRRPFGGWRLTVRRGEEDIALELN